MKKYKGIDAAEYVRAAMFTSGIASASYGAWLFSEPLGFAVFGTVIFICAVIGEYRSKA